MPAGRLAHIAYRMFKKFDLEVDTNDVQTLPTILQSAINGDAIKNVFDFWQKAAQAFKGLNKISDNFPFLGHVQGPIHVYMAVPDVGAVRCTNYSQDFWAAFTSFIQYSQTV